MISKDMRRLAVALLAAAASVVAASCSSSSVTAVRLDVRYDETWDLDALSVSARETDRDAPLADELLVEVPDGWAGEELEMMVTGLRAEQRVAAGRTTVTPELGREVTAVVALSRLPCGAWCLEGDTQCQGDGVVRCEQRDDDTCMEWSEPMRCTGETPSCSLGRCLPECVDECAEGESQCVGPGRMRRCGQTDSDPCLDWQPAVSCAGGESCIRGRCVQGCSDQCEAGARRCIGTGVSQCGDLNLDGCTEWGPPTPCGEGDSCEDGECVPLDECTDECTGASCEDQTFIQCGQYDLDPCLERSAGTSCTPEDSCREGRCAPESGCESVPKVCMEPPESVCVDTDTLRVFDTTGSCTSDGSCDYTSREVDCPSCPDCDPCSGITCDSPPEPATCYQPTGTCSEGSCSYTPDDGASCDDGDPCTEGDSCDGGSCTGTPVTCDTPPSDECVDADTLRTYELFGSCSEGSCTYPSSDIGCSFGCEDGVCLDSTGCSFPEVPCPEGCCTWDATTVDPEGDVGSDPMVAVDPMDRPHVVYDDETNRRVKYAKWNGSSWDIVSLSPTSVENGDIAIDGTGQRHVVMATSSCSTTCGEILYTSNSGSGWSTASTLGSPGTSDGHPRIDLAGTTPWVGFARSNDKVSLVIGGGTPIEKDSVAGLHRLVGFATDGTVAHFALHDSGGSRDLFHATVSESSYDESTVSSSGDVGRDPDLAIDGSGNLRLVFYDDGGIGYAAWNGTGWDTDTVDGDGIDPAIALDADGTPHVAYYRSESARYATRLVDGSWRSWTLKDGSRGTGWYSDITIDSEGRPHVVFYDNAERDLVYAVPR